MIRIIRDHEETPEFDTRTYLFWEGQEFIPCMGDRAYWESHGTEVKTHGEYVWIPAEVFTVISD